MQKIVTLICLSDKPDTFTVIRLWKWLRLALAASAGLVPPTSVAALRPRQKPFQCGPHTARMSDSAEMICKHS
jgi:hypothetical protein